MLTMASKLKLRDLLVFFSLVTFSVSSWQTLTSYLFCKVFLKSASNYSGRKGGIWSRVTYWRSWTLCRSGSFSLRTLSFSKSDLWRLYPGSSSGLELFLLWPAYWVESKDLPCLTSCPSAPCLRPWLSYICFKYFSISYNLLLSTFL